jgi:hypothetical protein
MIRKEQDRLTIMVGIKRQELTLVAAAQVMDLSYRQAKRMWRWYIRPTATSGWPATTKRYADFGPTLAAEYLAQDDGLQVDHEILAALAIGRRQTHRAHPARIHQPRLRKTRPR